MGRKIIKTFYDWCIENNRQDLLERFDVEANKSNVDIFETHPEILSLTTQK